MTKPAGNSRLAHQVILTWCVAFVVIGACSCGGPGYESVSLQGALSVNGQPVKEGGITFSPLSGNRGPGVYAEVRDGHYQANAVPTGEVRVSFMAVEYTGKKVQVFGEEVPESKIIVPARYRAGTVIDVRADDTTRDFDLSDEPS